MKTILVVYTNTALTAKQISDKKRNEVINNCKVCNKDISK